MPWKFDPEIGLYFDSPLSGLTVGSVLFAGAGGVISQDNANLFWDDTNKRLGIGTVSPNSRFNIRNKAVGTNAFTITNTAGTVDILTIIEGASGAGNLYFKAGGGNVIFAVLSGANSYLNHGGNFGIGTVSPTAKFSVFEKCAMNADGGFMIKLTNKTGANSVKGEVVTVYDTTAIDNAVKKTVNDIPTGIGVFYEAGIADGAEAWIVTSGMADVYFGGDAVRGNLARTTVTGDAFTTSGYAISDAAPASPFSTDKHFCEIGHVLASRTGAGLAKVNLHFN